MELVLKITKKFKGILTSIPVEVTEVEAASSLTPSAHVSDLCTVPKGSHSYYHLTRKHFLAFHWTSW